MSTLSVEICGKHIMHNCDPAHAARTVVECIAPGALNMSDSFDAGEIAGVSFYQVNGGEKVKVAAATGTSAEIKRMIEVSLSVCRVLNINPSLTI